MRPACASDIVVGDWGARFMGRRFPCSVGKGGITNSKIEGDGATPRGTHYMPQILYRADRIPDINGTAILPRDLWCDASNDPNYNQAVKAPYAASHEKLRRGDRLYDLIIITDWNWPQAETGKGSAIFIHRWRKPRHPTEGCVAFRPDHLRWIAKRITPRTRLIVR
ncbi:L,D-transpeptidase-like protein [Pacificibacter maritimus]|uniref:L,D-transpeptidase-like protein n=1 Tax=Pacificibacter maritimus TaxID=762213 RepID=A0A3N4UI98_9RHOB|nr:L,D-transpeptidase family protein [Pacificibacter maritimus]RPE64847.1 L,D-transpeptidase-like protein [Pacificibacter maritimus]